MNPLIFSSKQNHTAPPEGGPSRLPPSKVPALIYDVQNALKNYQAFEASSQKLKGRIGPEQEQRKKELLNRYGQAVSELLDIAPVVNEEDFRAIQKLSQQLHNSNFSKRLKSIEEFRITIKKQEESLLSQLQLFADSLLLISQRSQSNEGLPWEQFALGSSPLHAFSEKKALLNLLSQFYAHIDSFVAQFTLSEKQQIQWKYQKGMLNEAIQEIQEKFGAENSDNLELIKKAEEGIEKGWNKQLSREIFSLIHRNLITLLGSRDLFILSHTHASVANIIERLSKSPRLLSKQEREILVSLAKAAEKEEYLQRILELYKIVGPKSKELHEKIGNILKSTQQFLEKINSDDPTQISLCSKLKAISLLIQELNLDPPAEAPKWNELMEAQGFNLTKIGAGANGEVWLAERSVTTETGAVVTEKYAIKTYKEKSKPSFIHWLRGNLGERTARVEHPNLIQTIGAFVDLEGVQAIVMPYYENSTDLFDYMHKQSLTMQERIGCARQILEGVKALHNQDIIHQDIKPENILVVPTKKGLLVLIIDAGHQEKLTTWKMRTAIFGGTPAYRAPEVQNGEMHGKGADVYSLAVVLHFLLTDRLPYRFDEKDRKTPIRSLDDPPELLLLPKGSPIRNLLEKMLEPDPINRPPITYVVHRFNEWAG